MSFCSYSTQLIVENKTQIENMFITSYMPYANGEFVKVYLYGLLCCNDSNQIHNPLDQFAKALNMTEAQIEEAFLYWQEQGIVQNDELYEKIIFYFNFILSPYSFVMRIQERWCGKWKSET